MAAALELDTKSAIALGVGALLLAYFILGVDRRKDLPPTPPGVPLLGNLPDIIKASKKGIMHILFQEYAQKYGDVVRIRAGPNEVRSSIYEQGHGFRTVLSARKEVGFNAACFDFG